MHDNRLIDRWGRPHTYMRISVTDRCNLRCRYCMPNGNIPWKPSAELLTDDEIVHLAGLFARLGITKIRLTGGEPMVRPNIESLVDRLVRLDGISIVAMTTNGTFLREKARSLKEAGLTSLNISLDSLQPNRFAAITGRNQLADVLAGIDAALVAGFAPLRINTVIMKQVNDDELTDFVSFSKDRRVCVRFIEFMPSLASLVPPAELVSYEEMKQRIESQHHLEPLVPVADSQHSVVKEYGINGFKGTVGFITPMTSYFCERCNRLRLTASGALKSCLFYTAEVSLRDALRGGGSDERLRELVRDTVQAKREFPPQKDRVIAPVEPGMFAVGG